MMTFIGAIITQREAAAQGRLVFAEPSANV